MEKFHGFSHLNGAEYLVVKKLSIRREIIAMLSTSQREVLTERVSYPNNSLLDIFNVKHSGAALRSGWQNMSVGFEKDRVALHILTPPFIKSSVLEGTLGNWLWGYTSGKIDVGVGIVLPNIASKRVRGKPEMNSPIDNFNEIVGEINKLGRNLPLVPFLLISTPL